MELENTIRDTWMKILSHLSIRLLSILIRFVKSCNNKARMHAAIGLDLHNLYHNPKGEEKKTKEPRKMVVLDVGGERFSAMRSTLLR